MDYSLIASAFVMLRLAPPSRLAIFEAQDFSSAHIPPFPPDVPVLLVGIPMPELVSQVRSVLLSAYPREHLVRVLTNGEPSDVKLDALDHVSAITHLYIPPMEKGTSFEAFAEIVARLRAPDGCPWDREQTHQTLRTHLLEEAYETLSAIDANDPVSMREEFGDLLLQILLNSQIARELNEFTITEVIKSIHDKLIRRHPHVFGETRVEGVDGVLQNWEKLKEKERRGNKEDKGLLDGVPAALPALVQAQEYQERAARVGFDWPEIEGVLEKVREEIEEIKNARDLEEVKTELGDLLFVLVNLARWRKVDAESALREANIKFKKRFAHVENGAKSQGRNLSDLSLEEMDGFWNEAKKSEL